MKKAVITLALVLTLGASGVLASCTSNAMSDGTGTESGTKTETVTSAPKETSTEGKETGTSEAESKMEDMSEHATHGVDDGTPGGHSTRGGARRMPLVPRGK